MTYDMSNEVPFAAVLCFYKWPNSHGVKLMISELKVDQFSSRLEEAGAFFTVYTLYT